jgi:hypothetical protein
MEAMQYNDLVTIFHESVTSSKSHDITDKYVAADSGNKGANVSESRRLKHYFDQNQHVMDNINQKLYELESSFYHIEARQYGLVTSSFGRPKRQISIALLGGALIGGLVTSLYNSFTQASLADILNEKQTLYRHVLPLTW